MAIDAEMTEELLRRAGSGDDSALQQLLGVHRDRLRRMVAARMDPRMAARVDPSDVVQEALLEASKKLADYLRERPIPFYPWLRQLAWEQLVNLHRRHVRAQRRSVLREEYVGLSDDSAVQLARCLMSSGTSPSGQLLRAEMRDRVRTALARLASPDREVLVMRYVEGLSTPEMAGILGVSERTVQSRHRRALERLQTLLGDCNLANN